MEVHQHPTWHFQTRLCKCLQNIDKYLKFGEMHRPKTWRSLMLMSYLSSITLSPGQTELLVHVHVDASWKPGSTCDSVWPGLACTGIDLQWLALTLAEIKFARKSKQSISPFGHPTQVNVSWVMTINILSANEIQEMSVLEWVFCNLPIHVLVRKLACPFCHPTQVSKQFQLASTCNYLRASLSRA